MGFLKRLFGGGEEKPSGGDPHGIYLYARCGQCGAIVRVRADKQHDLMNTGGGYEWHKTIVDARCFRRMQTVVQFDRGYNVTHASLEGGDYVTEADWQAQESARP